MGGGGSCGEDTVGESVDALRRWRMACNHGGVCEKRKVRFRAKSSRLRIVEVALARLGRWIDDRRGL